MLGICSACGNTEWDKAAGVIMNECRLLEDAGYAHFITKRFDRNNNKKIHMQTLGAISHIDYNIPGLCRIFEEAWERHTFIQSDFWRNAALCTDPGKCCCRYSEAGQKNE